MTAFADSSALVKLYADEPGYREVRALAEPLVASQLARVEVPAAFWRKQRTGELSSSDAGLLTEEFVADWFSGRFVVVRPDSELLDDAARLVAVHGLRAYDGVQLASALQARAADPECDTFSGFDDHLVAAAAAEGMGAP